MVGRLGMTLRFVSALTAVALLLGACSDAPQQNTTVASVLALPSQIKAEVARRRAGPQPPVTVTPGMLAATKEAALQVNPLSLGGSNFLKRALRRTDAQPGTIEVWRTSDKAQLFLRDGILIGSRGLGGDILSSQISVAQRAFQSGSTVSGQRSFVMSRGDHASGEMVLNCIYQYLGAAKTQVVDRVYDTQHFRESCSNATVRITNEYWRQPNSGVMRKSRQWAGPSVGYFEMILLKE